MYECVCIGDAFQYVMLCSLFHCLVLRKPVNLIKLTLKVLVTTIDAQWEGTGDVGLARYEPALLPLRPTIRVLSYSK